MFLHNLLNKHFTSRSIVYSIIQHFSNMMSYMIKKASFNN